MTEGRRDTIIVVGAGASGVIIAANLLRSPSPSLRVTLVERRAVFGQGLAYSTANPSHLLNVTAARMSAYADDAGHFRRWLDAGIDGATPEPFYAPRPLYARYLGEILASLQEAEPVRLRRVNETVTGVSSGAGGIEVSLANGASLVGHVAVIATGHEDGGALVPHAVRPGSPEDGPLDADATVLVLGSGLSMADAVLSLHDRGHRGPIVVLSRRGQMSRPHRPGRAPYRLDSADIPLGTEPSYMLRWLRETVRRVEARGGDWRDVMDGLRPLNQRIWLNWPLKARRSFLRHGKAWWDVHRHRMAPSVHARLTSAMEEGRLRLLAGRLAGIEARDGRLLAKVRRRDGGCESLAVDRVYQCTGVIRDIASGPPGLVRSLVENGLARPDPTGLGLEVTPDCALIGQNGRASPALYAIGPLTRGALFEIEAVPDIREQCAALARRLTATTG